MRMRKGFTLIELLIVIIIIGILATAMLLTSGNSTAAAKAATVINDLRSMKTAAVMFYFASHDDNIPASFRKVEYLFPFMDDAKKFEKNRKGHFIANGSGWFVGIDVDDAAVRKLLAGKAETMGFYGDWACTVPYTDAHGIVIMKVR